MLVRDAERTDGVISLDAIRAAGASRTELEGWVRRGRLRKVGPRSFVVAGSPPTWAQRLRAVEGDLAGRGYLAGRTVAQLRGLDGFHADAVEVLVPVEHRGLRVPAVLASTAAPIPRRDTVVREGLHQLTVERMLLDASLFGFTADELHNAIDSAIRLRLVPEARLRARALAQRATGRHGNRRLVAALCDAGGESALERDFLRLLRQFGLPRPRLQVTYRLGTRTLGRVDAEFPGGLVVELAGHGTHATRTQRQREAQRQTELTLLGKRVLTFTWEDVHRRPAWVAAQLTAGLDLSASAANFTLEGEE